MNRKITYIYFSVATAASIAFRLFLLIFAIDPKSGFVKTEYFGLSTFMLILIALAAILVFVFSRSSNVTFSKEEKTTSLFNKVVSFSLAVTILFEVIFSPLSKMLPAFQQGLDLIAALLAFCTLICYAFQKELKISFNPLIYTLPLVFFIIRLVGVFTVFSAFSMIVDIVFELAALCALLVGFLFFAKCENFSSDNIKKQVAFASFMFASSLGLTASVPKILLNILGHSEYIHINSVPMYSVFFASVFLLLYSVEHFKFKLYEK